MPHHRHHKIQTHKASREDSNGNVNVHETHAEVQAVDNHQVVQCCVPSGCLQTGESIDPSDPGNAVRVVCNNDQCKEGIWMHQECFVEWENVVLAYLKSCGRARSWSEKQRLQNLWTKKGYDLAFKACDCKCGRGHLRKDLDYFAPPKVDNAKKPKKKSKKNDRPMPVVSNTKNGHYSSHSNTGGGTNNNNNYNLNGNINNNHNVTGILTNNANRNANQNVNLQTDGNGNNNANANINKNHSTVKKEVTQLVNATSNNNNVSDRNNNSTGSTNSVSCPINANVRPRTNSGSCSSPGKFINHVAVRPRTDSLGSTGSSSPVSMGSGSLSSSPCMNGNTFVHNVRTAKAKFDPNTDIAAVQAAMTNLFKRRHDLSAFNILPRHKQNPYHIKMEDEGPPGNDEIRVFVLAHLGSYRVTSLNCVLCKRNLPVFDRYPMIDGTFFLSPQAYDDSVVQVVSDGRLQYINAVCVNCLEGGNDIRCKACKQKWDGSTLLLGSMYSYDIFAAMPCCQKRLSCKHCHRAVVDIGGGLPFYSAYSRMIACPYCKAHDYHFIRPMAETFAVKDVIWN